MADVGWLISESAISHQSQPSAIRVSHQPSESAISHQSQRSAIRVSDQPSESAVSHQSQPSESAISHQSQRIAADERTSRTLQVNVASDNSWQDASGSVVRLIPCSVTGADLRVEGRRVGERMLGIILTFVTDRTHPGERRASTDCPDTAQCTTHNVTQCCMSY
jgi:hypothetical protein